jgi:hypothetical protein
MNQLISETTTDQPNSTTRGRDHSWYCLRGAAWHFISVEHSVQHDVNWRDNRPPDWTFVSLDHSTSSFEGTLQGASLTQTVTSSNSNIINNGHSASMTIGLLVNITYTDSKGNSCTSSQTFPRTGYFSTQTGSGGGGPITD